MASFRDIAQTMDSVTPPSSMRELLEMHRWSPSERKSFQAICDRHDHPEKRERELLVLNTFLMDLTPLLSEPVEFVTGNETSKPAVEDRARAIGEIIRADFDIALLSEVFEDNVRERVLAAWSEGERPSEQEDSAWSTDASSGLVTLSQSDNLQGREFHEYQFESGNDALRSGPQKSDGPLS